ncbi:MAG: NfeD family protein [Actinomycetia bacterium]|nr:NfeD family protein [Actinomycetes bacterium]
MPEWGWWVLGALVLLGVEALTLDLLFASLAVGAVVGAIVGAFGAPVLAQALAALVAALLTLLVLRPIGLKLLKTEGTDTNIDALIGARALVVERVDSRGGRVKIGGEVWSARVTRSGAEFVVGADLVVMSIDGATAVVDVPNTEPDSGSTGE